MGTSLSSEVTIYYSIISLKKSEVNIKETLNDHIGQNVIAIQVSFWPNILNQTCLAFAPIWPCLFCQIWRVWDAKYIQLSGCSNIITSVLLLVGGKWVVVRPQLWVNWSDGNLQLLDGWDALSCIFTHTYKMVKINTVKQRDYQFIVEFI